MKKREGDQRKSYIEIQREREGDTGVREGRVGMRFKEKTGERERETGVSEGGRGQREEGEE